MNDQQTLYEFLTLAGIRLETIKRKYLEKSAPDSSGYFLNLGRFFLDQAFYREGYELAGDQCLLDGKFILSPMERQGFKYSFLYLPVLPGDNWRPSAEQAAEWLGEYAFPDSLPIFCFTNFLEDPAKEGEFIIVDPLESSQLLLWLTVAEVKGRSIFALFSRQAEAALLRKFITAYNTGNRDFLEAIFDETIQLERSSGTYGGKQDVAEILLNLQPEIGFAEVAYLKIKGGIFLCAPAMYDTWFYLEYNGAGDSLTKISVIKETPDITVLRSGDFLQSADLDAGPTLVSLEAFKPMRTERFALKVIFSNGEKKKYRSPISDLSETNPTVEWESFIFTDEIFARVEIKDNRAIFPNGYSISAYALYFGGRQYLEPDICPAVLFENEDYRIEQFCLWKKAAVTRYYDKFWPTVIWGGKQFLNYFEGYASFCDNEGNRISSLDFHLIGDASEAYQPAYVGEIIYREHGFTYIDKSINFLTPPKYARVKPFDNGFAKVWPDGNSKHILMINIEGREIYTHERYVKVAAFSEGLCAVSTMDFDWQDLEHFVGFFDTKAGYWGYINEQGEEVIAPQYLFASDFSQGLAVVCKGQWELTGDRGRYWSKEMLWGLIDTNGHEVIPCQYEEIHEMSDDDGGTSALYCVQVKTDDGSYKRGVMDRTGHWLIEPRFEEKLYWIEEGYLTMHGEPYEALYDLNGKKLILEGKYHYITILARDRFIVAWTEQDEQIYQLIDSQGRPLLPGRYQWLSTLHNQPDYFTVKRRDAHGVMRHELMLKDGTVIFSSPYEIAGSTWTESFQPEKRRAFFKENEKFGLISFNHDILLPAIYDKLSRGYFETYHVEINAQHGLLGRDGTPLLPFNYEDIQLYDDGMLILRQGPDSIVGRLTYKRPTR